MILLKLQLSCLCLIFLSRTVRKVCKGTDIEVYGRLASAGLWGLFMVLIMIGVWSL